MVHRKCTIRLKGVKTMLYSEIKNDILNIEKIDVKPFISILLKDAIINGNDSESLLIDGIIASCVKLKDGMYYIDYAALEVSKLFSIILFYTDIELDTDDSIYEIHDFFMSNSLSDYILYRISDINFLNSLIDSSLKQYIDIKNSIPNILQTAIMSILDRMPESKEIEKFLNKLPSMINNIKPENLEFLKNISQVKK